MSAVNVSIIIPCYNAASTLGAQLEALARQTDAEPFEVLVVDNRSTDNPAAVVAQYQPRLPGLRLVPATAKQGRSYACNIGAQAAVGDQLIFIDADDVVADDWLGQLLAASHGRHFVGGAVEINKLNPGAPWRPNPVPSSSHPALNFLPQSPGANMLLTRRAFDAVNGFSEDIPPCEDIDISWRVQLAGFPLHDAPQAVVHIRYRPSTEARWRQLLNAAECHVFLYRRFRAEGMQRYPTKEILGRYWWLLRNAPRYPRKDSVEQGRYVKRLAVCYGRLRGSLKYRTLYL